MRRTEAAGPVTTQCETCRSRTGRGAKGVGNADELRGRVCCSKRAIGRTRQNRQRNDGRCSFEVVLSDFQIFTAHATIGGVPKDERAGNGGRQQRERERTRKEKETESGRDAVPPDRRLSLSVSLSLSLLRARARERAGAGRWTVVAAYRRSGLATSGSRSGPPLPLSSPLLTPHTECREAFLFLEMRRSVGGMERGRGGWARPLPEGKGRDGGKVGK
ncbi:hypothetical protein LX32DRAFT_148445 [Colletotrichum zoysiae]|uniref:Uncharacterized protein n=1 Tax=Colletotrichum zoysiae TaxID=1216348 RepID=A0AAD9H7Q1_9PEZI|nr:hypothetical protein LX32DRAFT_148445 [Colletotrichum zoysiae]